jgi:hypothetical protein
MNRIRTIINLKISRLTLLDASIFYLNYKIQKTGINEWKERGVFRNVIHNIKTNE